MHRRWWFRWRGVGCKMRHSITVTEQEHCVKLSNFLFPESRDPALDERVIDETIAEAKLTEKLGFDAVWLAEHHFDGICAYVDPISFAAALATAASRSSTTANIGT